MSDLPELQPHQRILWSLVCSNFPADILRTLEDTDHIRNDELHHLYDILQSCHGKTPSHLMTKLAGLSEPAAVEMVNALRAFNITYPSGEDEETQNTRKNKPYFYSRKREQLWHCVADLFELGYLGSHRDVSMRENVPDFLTMHILYKLEVYHEQSQRDEDTDIQNPAHRSYHEMSDPNITWCVWRLAPLVAKPCKTIP